MKNKQCSVCNILAWLSVFIACGFIMLSGYQGNKYFFLSASEAGNGFVIFSIVAVMFAIMGLPDDNDRLLPP